MKLYYYPSCSSCKSAIKFIKNNQINVKLIDISVKTPSKAELTTMLDFMEGNIRSLFNTSGKLYREMDMKNRFPDLSDKEAITLLSKNGMLVKRPFLIGKDFGLLGFKIDKWEEALL